MSLKAASFHVNGLYYLDQKAPPLRRESLFVGKVSEIWHAAFPRKILSVDLPASTKHPSLQLVSECVCVCMCVCVCERAQLRAWGRLHANLPHCFRVTAFPVFRNKAFLHKPLHTIILYLLGGSSSYLHCHCIRGHARASLSPCKPTDYSQGLAGYQDPPPHLKAFYKCLRTLDCLNTWLCSASLNSERGGRKCL